MSRSRVRKDKTCTEQREQACLAEMQSTVWDVPGNKPEKGWGQIVESLIPS